MILIFESPDLEQWTRDLVDAPRRIDEEMLKVVKRGANNIKEDAKQRVADARIGKGYIKHYAASITYDEPTESGHEISTEIGPDSDRKQGHLGIVIEYGNAQTPPLPHLEPALDEEDEGFVDASGDAAVQVLT